MLQRKKSDSQLGHRVYKCDGNTYDKVTKQTVTKQNIYIVTFWCVLFAPCAKLEMQLH